MAGSIDLIAFSQTTQNNGYDYVTPAAGTDDYSFSGDDLYIQDDGKIVAACFIDATTTKGARARFKAKSQADWSEFTGCSLDSGLRAPGIIYCGHVLKKGDILNAQVDNLNTNEISNLLLAFSKKPGAYVTEQPPEIPAGAIWIKGIFTTACVAITWTKLVTGTWSYNFQRDRKYKILGMAATSAAGLAARLIAKTGSSPEFLASRPGVPASYELTEVNGPKWYFMGTDFVFEGLNPPTVEGLDTTTSSSFKIDLLILPL